MKCKSWGKLKEKNEDDPFSNRIYTYGHLKAKESVRETKKEVEEIH
jgi:hypothetical protein